MWGKEASGGGDIAVRAVRRGKGGAVTERRERFGDRLRRLREAAGYSQEELAQRAGLSAKAISALERGERKRPYPDTLRRLAESLELSADERSELAAASRVRGDPTSTSAPDLHLPPRTMTGLPGELTPLIGREREVEVVRHLLLHSGGRFLTLTGPGGVGKTRPALHLARAVSDQYPGGVVWVELAPLGDAALVLPTIARSLGLSGSSNPDTREDLHSWLRGRRALLVLDNFEHVLDAATDMATLLLACPGLGILATSRAPLSVRGEQEYVVPPLELPTARQARETVEVAAVPSVQLFVWQARQRNPSFELRNENAAAVAEICRRLEGVPLALELAAARVKVLGAAELLARLGRALPVLTGGARDLPARQRTMEGAIRWSYDLLNPPERALFRRLSAFTGGWTLEAAGAIVNVAGDLDLDILDGVEALVDQSLVRQGEGPDVRQRFTMLETFREFGLARLEEAGETAIVRRAHIDWCLALAEAAEPNLIGPEQGIWLERLETEHDNLRAAINAALAGSDAAALRIAGALWRFWYMRGYLSEGSRWLALVLENGAESAPAKQARALHGAGVLAQLQGDYPRAEACLEESLLILRELGDQQEVATVLRRLGSVAREQGDAPRAVEFLEESLVNLRKLGDQRGLAIALGHLGITAQPPVDYSQAVEFMEESLVILRELGDNRGAANALRHLGAVAYERGDIPQSAEFLGESLLILRELGDTWGLVHGLEIVADMAVSLAHAEPRARLLGAATTIRQELGTPAMAVVRARIDQAMADLGTQIDESTLADLLTSGRATGVDEAVNEALTFLTSVREHGSSTGGEPRESVPWIR